MSQKLANVQSFLSPETLRVSKSPFIRPLAKDLISMNPGEKRQDIENRIEILEKEKKKHGIALDLL